MAAARYHHAVAVLRGKLYAVGGYNGLPWHYELLRSVERYDPALSVGAGCCAGDGVVPSRSCGARRRVVRRGWAKRQTPPPPLGGAVRPGHKRLGGGCADVDGTAPPLRVAVL